MMRSECRFAVAVAVTVFAGLGAAPCAAPPTGALDEYGYPTNVVAAAEQGRAEARRDLTNSVRVIKFAGLPSPEWDAYRELLSTRCGVQLQPIAGCLVTSGLVAYRDAYNEVTSSAVKQQYGTNIFHELWLAAEQRFREKIESGSTESAGHYKVRKGDTFVRIAQTQRLKLADLMVANPGVEPRKLKVGQVLVVPAANQVGSK